MTQGQYSWRQPAGLGKFSAETLNDFSAGTFPSPSLKAVLAEVSGLPWTYRGVHMKGLRVDQCFLSTYLTERTILCFLLLACILIYRNTNLEYRQGQWSQNQGPSCHNVNIIECFAVPLTKPCALF